MLPDPWEIDPNFCSMIKSPPLARSSPPPMGFTLIGALDPRAKICSACFFFTRWPLRCGTVNCFLLGPFYGLVAEQRYCLVVYNRFWKLVLSQTVSAHYGKSDRCCICSVSFTVRRVIWIYLDQLYWETIKELVKLSAIGSWVVFARFGLPILRDACGYSDYQNILCS